MVAVSDYLHKGVFRFYLNYSDMHRLEKRIYCVAAKVDTCFPCVG